MTSRAWDSPTYFACEHSTAPATIPPRRWFVRTYTLQARIGGERVHHCNASVVPTGAAAYPACAFEDPVVTVVHGELDGPKCTVLGLPNRTRPTVHSVGTAKNFSIVSKDSFGNTRLVTPPGY